MYVLSASGQMSGSAWSARTQLHVHQNLFGEDATGYRSTESMHSRGYCGIPTYSSHAYHLSALGTLCRSASLRN